MRVFSKSRDNTLLGMIIWFAGGGIFGFIAFLLVTKVPALKTLLESQLTNGVTIDDALTPLLIGTLFMSYLVFTIFVRIYFSRTRYLFYGIAAIVYTLAVVIELTNGQILALAHNFLESYATSSDMSYADMLSANSTLFTAVNQALLSFIILDVIIDGVENLLYKRKYENRRAVLEYTHIVMGLEDINQLNDNELTMKFIKRGLRDIGWRKYKGHMDNFRTVLEGSEQVELEQLKSVYETLAYEILMTIEMSDIRVATMISTTRLMISSRDVGNINNQKKTQNLESSEARVEDVESGKSFLVKINKVT